MGEKRGWLFEVELEDGVLEKKIIVEYGKQDALKKLIDYTPEWCSVKLIDFYTIVL